MTLIDEFTRECPAIRVARRINSFGVLFGLGAPEAKSIIKEVATRHGDVAQSRCGPRRQAKPKKRFGQPQGNSQARAAHFPSKVSKSGAARCRDQV